jgi:hypothetical protein
MRRPLLVLLAWLLLTPWLVAQETPACRSCQGQGSAPCGKHGKALALEQATLVLHCSAAADCKACAGALRTLCKHCASPTAATAIEQRQALAREWLAGCRAKIDALTKTPPFQHLATLHFDLAWKLDGAAVGTDKIDAHTRMHLYGERLEAVRSLFLQTFELPEGDLEQRFLVCMSQEQKDHGVLGPRLCGMGNANSTGIKLMGPEYVYSMWNDRRSLPDDEAVHRHIVHNVTHLLLSQMPTAKWLGNQKHGWLDEGIAHWFEDKVVGKCTNFCYEEILLDPGAGFRGGKWRPAVRKLLDEGKQPSFVALSQQNTDQLKFEEHAFVFAYIDFLLAVHGGGKLRDLLRAVKDGRATAEALPAVYGISLLQFDELFLPWVKANYSVLPPR